jgi:hypothetical protein
LNVGVRRAAVAFASSVAGISLAVVGGNFSRKHSCSAIFLIPGAVW